MLGGGAELMDRACFLLVLVRTCSVGLEAGRTGWSGQGASLPYAVPSSNKCIHALLIHSLYPLSTSTEDCFRIYHEVEDVGKTVKATKRRARWTFSFGEKGQERVSLIVHCSGGLPLLQHSNQARASSLHK